MPLDKLEALDLFINKDGCSSTKWNGNHERVPFCGTSRVERVSGIEPPSSAWKADIISHYTTPASNNNLITSRVKSQ